MNGRIQLAKLAIILLFTLVLASDSSIGQPETIKFENDDIAALISQAKAGDKIVLPRGRHLVRQLVIDKPLELIGTGIDASETILDGGGQTTILCIRADNVVVRNLTLCNVGNSFIEDRAAIKLEKVRGCVVSDNRIINSFFGIYLDNCERCEITGNLVRGEGTNEVTSGNGIHLWHSRNIYIARNQVSHHRDGIYFEFVEDSRIEDNVSDHNLRYGLHFMFSHNDAYIGNRFEHNGAGVAVMYTRNVVMRRNRFGHNWGSSAYGLLLKDINDSEITHNLFDANTTGIYSEGSNRIAIEHNQFRSNGYAVKLLGNCSDHRFSGNSFTGNTFDVTTNTTRHDDNRFAENYWSAYQGYDLDHDGFGDVPYHPVRLFAYMVEKQPAAILFLHSFLVESLDTAERVMPVFTPDSLSDKRPLMHVPANEWEKN